ncbi:hypothetical protein F7231_14135 [Fibrella aestuarina]|uniref:NTF2-like N-terminal transpeptidase domain-containing protein n=2 Tax=Fibrivirga algicola TaxID=2950420 RepID=A0ABX0QGL2_9BACT|nr:hypothetical protein [Fibrivirga algicola]
MKKKIADQPSLASIKERIAQLEKLAVTEEQRYKLADFKGHFEKISTLPDRFNNAFSSRGWIAYDSLNEKIMEKALAILKSDGIHDAEKCLIGYYNKNTVELGITRLWGVEVFRDRLRIIKLAYEDYVSGRYHACIPVLLMMIDGVVSDAGDNIGFFAEKSDVTSWDSIVGHDTGLSLIKDLFYKSRRTTSKSKITLPFRNGILHGRDLGYANEEVAAKCWALMFSVRDFLAAKQDEAHRKEVYTIESLKTFEDIIREIEILDEKLLEVCSMDEFRRSPVTVGIDYPVAGLPDEYLINTPERVVAEFISLWKQNNFGQMSQLMYRPDHISQGKMAGRIKAVFKGKKISHFSIQRSEDLSSCKTDITLKLGISFEGNSVHDYDLIMRVLYCEVNSTDLVVNPSKVGKWKIAENFSSISQIGTQLEWLE